MRESRIVSSMTNTCTIAEAQRAWDRMMPEDGQDFYEEYPYIWDGVGLHHCMDNIKLGFFREKLTEILFKENDEN